MVGNISEERGCCKNGIFCLKWMQYGQKVGTLDCWGILKFWCNILLYPIKGYEIIGLKQCIWAGYSGTMASVENTTPVSTTVLIVQGKIFW